MSVVACTRAAVGCGNARKLAPVDHLFRSIKRRALQLI
jgi:hypothetical protein